MKMRSETWRDLGFSPTCWLLVFSSADIFSNVCLSIVNFEKDMFLFWQRLNMLLDTWCMLNIHIWSKCNSCFLVYSCIQQTPFFCRPVFVGGGRPLEVPPRNLAAALQEIKARFGNVDEQYDTGFVKRFNQRGESMKEFNYLVALSGSFSAVSNPNFASKYLLNTR